MRKKILFVQDKIPHYRVPLFIDLARSYNLTILTNSSNKLPVAILNEDLKIRYYSKTAFLGIHFLYPFIPFDSRLYDSIILEANPRIINLLFLLLRPSIYSKAILFGPWRSKIPFVNWLLKIYLSTYSHSLTYCEKHRQEFISLGVKSSRISTATNTVYCLPCLEKKPDKDTYFVSVGSLNHRKGLKNVIIAYSLYNVYIKALNQVPVRFLIVGDGPASLELKSLTNEFGLESYIIFLESITDDSSLSHLYRNAIASFSYSQAGLSVLQSLGYATPFVCHSTAISGGETSNIFNGWNGYFINSITEMSRVMIDLHLNSSIAEKLSINSLQYYKHKCSMQRFIDSFHCVINSRVTKNNDRSI